MASSPGTTQKMIRSLAHMLPPKKGAKFQDSKYPTQHRHRAKFIPPKDRFPFWNITVGDTVVLRRGKVSGEQKEKEKDSDSDSTSEATDARPRGKVVSLDRSKNWLWLRDEDENTRLAPKQLRHIQPRLVDPEGGLEKGFGPNTMEVPKPVHYSQCRLIVPGREDSPAIRLTRSEPFFNNSIKAFQWKRFAILKNKDGSREKVHVPWPKGVELRRELSPTTSPNSLVSLSTFVPWDPKDPINLSSKKSRVSPQSTLRALISLTQRLNDKKTSLENKSGSRYTFHEGMKVKTIKPPPIAQAPTSEEKVWMREKEIKNWSNDKSIKENYEKFEGKSFIGEDYLELSPGEGPWSDIISSDSNSKTSSSSSKIKIPKDFFINQNNSNSNSKGIEGIQSERNKEGKLINELTSFELDSLPIELLMKNDLENKNGLKFRMKNYKEGLERKKSIRERKEKDLEEGLKILRERVLLDKTEQKGSEIQKEN